MKTEPKYQYDIFLVKGEDPAPPPGSHIITTYDVEFGGHWAFQYGALVAEAGLPALLVPSPPTSWNETV